MRALESARAVQATGRVWRLRREGGLLSWNTAALQSANLDGWHDEPKRRRRVLLDSDEDSEGEEGAGVRSGARSGVGGSSQVAREGGGPRDGQQRVILDDTNQPGAREGGGRVRRLVRMYELRNRATRGESARGRDT